MKIFALFSILTIYLTDLLAQDLKNGGQKPAIDHNVYDNWPSVDKPAISNDGSFVLYQVNNQPAKSNSLIIQATKSTRRISEIGISDAWFTQDSRYVLFHNEKDSLGIISLNDLSTSYIPDILAFKFVSKGSEEWLAYQLKKSKEKLVLRNILKGTERTFASVNNYIFSNDAKFLMLYSDAKRDDTIKQSIEIVDLSDGSNTRIWSTKDPDIKVDNFVFDQCNLHLAFIVRGDVKRNQNSLWYYKAKTNKAIPLTNNESEGLDSSLIVDEIQGFNGNGESLIFKLKETASQKNDVNAVKVDVWSYFDAKLQSQQLKELTPKSYAAIINVNDSKIIRLEQNDELILSLQSQNQSDGSDNYRLMLCLKGHLAESNWNSASRQSLYLISMVDGKRTKIKQTEAELSLGGKFLIYYDKNAKNYFTYEIASGVIRNITKNISAPWLGNDENDQSFFPTFKRGVAGWMKQDSFVLIYDRNDIWQIDPKAKNNPKNITNNYGSKNNIVFSLGVEDYTRKYVDCNEKIILTAFNKRTKDNGFYSKKLSTNGEPELLTMGPYIYDVPNHNPSLNGFPPIKALNTDVYLVRRMSSSESPNYFCTSDFKSFTQLSNIYPEKDFNWFKAELHTWKTLDGSTSQGVLYKPQNFNPRKKYPIVFYYYRMLSDRLNLYLEPAPSNGSLNIPWFVSNGYLVFTPDIHFKIGTTGEGALNSVVSAAYYFSKFNWVDSSKMGIQGISFGGFETNYLIANTQIFAAACSSSGLSDFISAYGSLSNNVSKQGQFEWGTYQIGATLWQRPDLYIKNSAIFRANKITTPFLMMHTKADEAVPFNQAIEFFTGLRRLGKKVWLLQYDEGQHSVWGKSADDFSIRLAQFFDHYLKNSVPPKWMTQGVPAALKGIENGYGYDPSGNCGFMQKNCKVCNKWNEQFKKTPEMFLKPSDEWHLQEGVITKQKPVHTGMN